MKKLLVFIVLFFISTIYSQNPPLSDATKVSVFTCGRGSELYSTFGHTALRIQDYKNNLDVVYNYGMFDFATENFYLKFVKGDLQYFVNATSYEEFIFEYQMDKREVIEQTLNLPLQKKQALFESLNANLASKDKYYTYKFIDRNCTTMVTDKINGLFNSKVIQKVDNTTISYRTVLYPYFENYFWNKLGINIVFGQKTDQKATQLFLPIELLNSLDKAVVNGEKLVTKKEVIVKGSEIKPSFSFLSSIYFIALLLFIIVLINKRSVFIWYLFALGLLGLVFCLLGFYSLHEELLLNYNVFLFNPLFVLFPFLSKKWFKILAIVSLAILSVYVIVMLNKPHLVLLLPFIISNFYILFRLFRDGKIEL